MTYSPVIDIIGIPAIGIFVGIVLSYFLRRLQRSIARDEALSARSKRTSRTPNVVYAQPTSLPVDIYTRIAVAVKTKNLALKLDGGKYAYPSLMLGHAPAS